MQLQYKNTKPLTGHSCLVLRSSPTILSCIILLHTHTKNKGMWAIFYLHCRIMHIILFIVENNKKSIHFAMSRSYIVPVKCDANQCASCKSHLAIYWSNLFGEKHAFEFIQMLCLVRKLWFSVIKRYQTFQDSTLTAEPHISQWILSCFITNVYLKPPKPYFD